MLVGQALLTGGAHPIFTASSTKIGKRQSIVVRAESEPRPSPQEPTPMPRPDITDPVQMVQWGGTLPSTRRLAVSGLAGLSIILAGNLFGATSFLLSLDGGKAAAASHLDVLIPIKGFKRCYDAQNGFEFVYPATWLADQRLYRRYAERMEQQRSLDPPSLRSPRPVRRDKYSEKYDPSAAFGPPGSTGEDNFSVVVAPIRDGFSLQKMGSPEAAAERFLDSVAPPNSDRVGTLISATSRRDPRDGELYYVMEFTVEKVGVWKRHNVAVYGARNGLIYTFNAQASEERYTPELAAAFAKSAASFRMTSSGASTADFPDRL